MPMNSGLASPPTTSSHGAVTASLRGRAWRCKAAAESLSRELRREPDVIRNAFDAWSCGATLREARDAESAADDLCIALRQRTITWQPTSEACIKAAIKASRALVAMISAVVRVAERLGGSPRQLREHCERQFDVILRRASVAAQELHKGRVAVEAW